MGAVLRGVLGDNSMFERAQDSVDDLESRDLQVLFSRAVRRQNKENT